MDSSQYMVKDIKCVDGKTQWYITNEKFLKIKQPLSSNEENQETRGPASVVNVKEAKKIQEIHGLTGKISTGVMSLSSTDTVGGATQKAVSSLAVGGGLIWTHFWSKKIHFFLSGEITKLQFKVNEKTTLTNSSVSKSSVDIGLKYKFNKRNELSGSFGISEKLLLSGVSSTVVELKKAKVPNIMINGRTSVHDFDSGFQLGILYGVGVLIKSSQDGYDTKSGSSYNAGISSRYSNKKRTFFINGSYHQESIGYENAKQTTQELRFSAGLGWSF